MEDDRNAGGFSPGLCSQALALRRRSLGFEWHVVGTSSRRPEAQVSGIRGMTWPYAQRAGDENRTRTTSLEGWGSTIELHPRAAPAAANARVMMP
jgi:hypothetical protein